MTRKPTLRSRGSGVLMHFTSLPGPFGVGDLGPAASRFAGLISSAGQRWWQVLPVEPSGGGNSPYTVLSAFAGSPLLISPEKLVDDGFLKTGEIRPSRGLSRARVRYREARRFKAGLLKRAFERFESQPPAGMSAGFKKFCDLNEDWLADYSLFAALKKSFGGAHWNEWSPPLRVRRARALAVAERKMDREIRFEKFLQFLFSRQWKSLRRLCAEKGLGLIGDIPIYVAHDSADVWANQDIFMLDRAGRRTALAGVPPDYFSRTGQLWGNPIYRWDVLRRRGYDWWLSRLKKVFERFDVLRLDHFIGFQRYYWVSPNSRTAIKGRWEEGPGAHFFERVRDGLGKAEFIAEDLGVVTSDVKDLRDRFEMPGIKILQFAFGDEDFASEYLPHNYPRDCVVYTGTHDNQTTVEWFNDPGARGSTRTAAKARMERSAALRYLGGDGREIHWDMIRLALSSVANTAILPVQDLLGLGAEARMNKPGAKRGNWEWRLLEGAFSEEVAERLCGLTETYGRSDR